jgi:Zn-dependent peptidase ImmA (M78 family)
MANDYASAVRNGTMQATRLHTQLGTQNVMLKHGGSIDVFGAIFIVGLPLVLRPLKGLLGAYLPDPIPGVMVTTERPLSIQRFTAAHELGHYRLGHMPSLDDEGMLRRMANVPSRNFPSSAYQEAEADAFAVGFLMPRWLIEWHCKRQHWTTSHFAEPQNVYQLALRLGASYEATVWTLERYKLISVALSRTLRGTQPREIKVALLGAYKPKDYRGDVWLLTEHDAGTRIDGSRNDHFVLRLNEHSGGGYLWNIDELRKSGFAVVSDDRQSVDEEGIGGPVTRRVTALPEEPQRGVLRLEERRPWQPSQPLTRYQFVYDFTGPEEAGLSRSEQRSLLEAA